jgi:hypothetical protein
MDVLFGMINSKIQAPNYKSMVVPKPDPTGLNSLLIDFQNT